MSWFWIGWSGTAAQLAVVAWQLWYTRRLRRRAHIELYQAGIEGVNDRAAVLIAFGWHWGARVERRAWVQRIMGMDNGE